MQYPTLYIGQRLLLGGGLCRTLCVNAILYKQKTLENVTNEMQNTTPLQDIPSTQSLKKGKNKNAQKFCKLK